MPHDLLLLQILKQFLQILKVCLVKMPALEHRKNPFCAFGPFATDNEGAFRVCRNTLLVSHAFHQKLKKKVGKSRFSPYLCIVERNKQVSSRHKKVTVKLKNKVLTI